MKKVVKSRGGRGGKKTKKKTVAVPSSAASIPAGYQEDRLTQMLEALPVLEGPKPPPPPDENPIFKGVFARLEAALNLGQGLELSRSEVNFVYHRFLSIEQRARRLPASVENSAKGLPPEIWEFISGSPTRGTFEADTERNKKWVDFLSKRAWDYFQRVPDSLLYGPSGAEKEAAENICSFIFLLIQKLKHATRINTPIRFAGRDAARAAYEKVLSTCHRTVETSKRRARRNAAYEKRGRKKAHTDAFSFQCEYWVRGIIFNHEDWLEDPVGDPPTFGKFPRPSPAKRFGEDPTARAEWENWLFDTLKHNIVIARNNDNEMKQAWRSHSTDLRRRIIPSFWEKAEEWRAMRKALEEDE